MEKNDLELLVEEIRINRTDIKDVKSLVYKENTDIRRELSTFKLRLVGMFSGLTVILNFVFELWRTK